MTGIERLRTIAGAWDEWGLGGTLGDVARQIERERTCDADTIENVRLIVGGVIDDMERHCLGHEGMEDSPVARWARELREAMDGAVTDEYRDALAWVRSHGGIDHVKSEWRSRVPYDRYERRRQSLLGHIAECETALGRRNRRIEELGCRVRDLTNENAELRKRAMPEGYEWLIEAWPKFEDYAPVKLGDMALIGGDADMVEAVQIWIHGKPVIYGDNGSQQLEKGERVRRPASATPAANLDTWQRIEEDARLKPFGYVDRVLGWDMSKSHSQNQARSAMTHDLVRRAKKLAGVDND